MRSARCRMIMLGAFLLACQTIAAAGNLNGMYSEANLNHWKSVLEPWVNEMVQQEIQPWLNIPGQKVTHIHIEMPTSSSSDLFGYEISGDTLTIPVVSVKFLYDLFTAHLWLEENGFDDSSVSYLSVLKYQDVSKFPGNRRPSPFEALAIPHNNAMEFTGGTAIDWKFQQLFNGALLFILAHEVGHALLDEEGQKTLTRENQADMFAFTVVEHAQYNPGGVAWLFIWLSIWSPTAADFPTLQKYQEWLQKTSRHPLSSERVGMAGLQLMKDPHVFLPGVPDSDQRVVLLKQMGGRMIRLAVEMDNLAKQQIMRDFALDIDIHSLAVHKSSQEGHP